MKKFDWEIFLKQESKKIILNYEEIKINSEENWNFLEVTSKNIQSEWFGYPGATEEQIVAAETPLAIIRPPSYRGFLKITNCWSAIPAQMKLYSTSKINWFPIENQNWIDEWVAASKFILPVTNEEYFVYSKNRIWNQPIRTEYIQTSLQISDEEDASVVLLKSKNYPQ
ncbi:MAG: hypothetical protein QNJ47_09160 [Nostocaceae cyanobacterium]|nr:hypothetical protein [Nostocaceae cyanobacterium]